MKHSFRTIGRCTAAILGFLAILNCGEERATGLDPSTALLSSRGLVECPTSQTLTTSLLVPLTGGTVSLAGSSITIPDGALDVPRLITVSVPASRYMEIEIHADDLTSLVFQKPVSITIDYSRCGRSNIDARPLRAWYIEKLTKQRLEDMGGVDDKADRTVRFDSGHLSNYAIAF